MTCRILFLQGNVLCNEATTPLYLPLTPGKRRDTGKPCIQTILHTPTHPPLNTLTKLQAGSHYKTYKQETMTI